MAIKDTKILTFDNLIPYLSNKKIKIDYKKNNFNIYNENSKHLLIIFTSIHDFYSLLENNKIYKFENIFLDKMNCRDLASNMQKTFLSKRIPIGILLEKYNYKNYYTFTGWGYANWLLNSSTISFKYKIIVISNPNQRVNNQKKSIKTKKLKI